MSDALRMWTVYDHPKDYPNNYVARMFLVMDGETRATDELMVCPELEPIREQLRARGLFHFTRWTSDDPVILETWM